MNTNRIFQLFFLLGIFGALHACGGELFFSDDFEGNNNMAFKMCADPSTYWKSVAEKKGYMKIFRANITNQAEGKSHGGVRAFALDIQVDKNTGKWGPINIWTSKQSLNPKKIPLNKPVYLTAFVKTENLPPDIQIKMGLIFNATNERNGKAINGGFYNFKSIGVDKQGWLVFQQDLSEFMAKKLPHFKDPVLTGWQLVIWSPKPFHGQRVKLFLDDVSIGTEMTKVGLGGKTASTAANVKGGPHTVGYQSLYKNFPEDSVNRVMNSSFELGFDSWYTGVYVTKEEQYSGNLNLPDPARTFSISEEGAFHGQKSMKISRPNCIQNVCRITSLPIPIEEGKAYTISFYAKADKPTTLRLQAETVWRKTLFKLTTKWKRYSLYIPAMQCEIRGSGKKFPGRYIIRFSQTGNETVWLDAVQLQQGRLSDYHDSEIVSLAVCPDNYDGLFLPKERPGVNISVFNGTSDNKKAKIKLLITDYRHKKVAEKIEFVDLAPLAGTVINKKMPSGYRHYKVYVKLEVATQQSQQSVSAVSVIDNLNNIKGNEFFGSLGCANNNPANFKDSLNLNRKIGMKWMMWYNVSRLDLDPNWRTDKKYWNAMEFTLDNILAYRFTPLIEISPVFPAFTKKNAKGIELVTPKEEKEVHDWCEHLSANLKGKAKYFGVFSEYMHGDLAPRARNIRKILQQAYSGLKQGNPNSIVVACGEDRASNRQMLGQLEAHFKLGSLNFMDVVSLHPYTCPDSPESQELQLQYNELKNMIRKYNHSKLIPIWGTEAGYRSVDVLRYDDVEPESMYYPHHITELEQAQKVIRDNIIAMGEGVARYESFYLDPGPRFFSFSFIQREDGIRPKTVFPAFNFMVKELSATIPVKRFEQSANQLMGYIFRKKNKMLAAIWRYNTDNSSMKAILELAPDKVKIFNLVGEPILTDIRKNIELDLNGSTLYIHADGVSEKDFISALEDIKINSLNFSFTLLTNNKASLTLDNGKIGTAKGTITINEGIAREFVLPPNETKKTVIEFTGVEVLTAKVDSNKGKISSEIKILPIRKTSSRIKIDANPVEFTESASVNLKKRHSRFPELKYGGAKDISADIRSLWDNENFYLNVNVHDDIYAAPYTIAKKPSMIWANDAIQVAFKREQDTGMTEINFSLTENGPGVFATMGKIDIAKIRYAIKRTKNLITYEIAIPWIALWPDFRISNKPDIKFNIAVIDNDGKPETKTVNRFIGDKQALQLTSGIVDGKNPGKFKYLILENSK